MQYLSVPALNFSILLAIVSLGSVWEECVNMRLVTEKVGAVVSLPEDAGSKLGQIISYSD
jgi:hypothetical protein